MSRPEEEEVKISLLRQLVLNRDVPLRNIADKLVIECEQGLVTAFDRNGCYVAAFKESDWISRGGDI